MRVLADFMHNNAVTSVVDVGCGDWKFSRVMDWSGIRYHGFYLVDTVIDINKDRFARDNITFATIRGISGRMPISSFAKMYCGISRTRM